MTRCVGEMGEGRGGSGGGGKGEEAREGRVCCGVGSLSITHNYSLSTLTRWNLHERREGGASQASNTD